MKTETTNSYPLTDKKRPDVYKPNLCIQAELMTKILHYCDCYPGYIHGIENVINTTGREECGFYVHGICVSFIMERFKRDESKCMPACNSFQFHMENLHYLSENADYQQQLRKQLNLEDDIAMHSAIIHLAENANIIQEETSTYPWTAFLSDTGGALGKNSTVKTVLLTFVGLFLGLSILNILRFIFSTLMR